MSTGKIGKVSIVWEAFISHVCFTEHDMIKTINNNSNHPKKQKNTLSRTVSKRFTSFLSMCVFFFKSLTSRRHLPSSLLALIPVLPPCFDTCGDEISHDIRSHMNLWGKDILKGYIYGFMNRGCQID